jgi:hypothetical protein
MCLKNIWSATKGSVDASSFGQTQRAETELTQASSTTIFPTFCPWKRPMKAAGA